MSQPGWFGGGGSFSARSYDPAGTVASEDDFQGNRSCSQNDPLRWLETQRVEGLTTSVDCASVNPAAAALPAGSRKTTRQWHPDWPLPVRSAAPGRITTWVYNGQPDPTRGNAVASCAPASALLPDGKPIAVLCTRVEQATLDADGRQGFNAAADGATPERRWAYTHNARGQVLTETDPLGHVTTSVYADAPTANAAIGDLLRVTNAAGHVTTFDRYDANGLLLQKTEPGGLVTTATYDSRRRPATITVSAGGVSQTTTHTYNLDGDLVRVQQPDGSAVQPAYDAGHRLVGWSDADGNSVSYTLDNAGNRIAEQWSDPGGTLARSMARVFDALNRLQAVSGVEE
jgi:YD repeat-containing protein